MRRVWEKEQKINKNQKTVNRRTNNEKKEDINAPAVIGQMGTSLCSWQRLRMQKNEFTKKMKLKNSLEQKKHEKKG